MKLPNYFTSTLWHPTVAVSISFMALMVSLAKGTIILPRTTLATSASQDLSLATNEIPTSAMKSEEALKPVVSLQTGNFSQFSRDVTDLRLTPELRSIKLRWTYEHDETNRPDSFRIRYCELTSWLAQIKCRHRELPVVAVAVASSRVQENSKSRAKRGTQQAQRLFSSSSSSDNDELFVTPTKEATSMANSTITVIKTTQPPATTMPMTTNKQLKIQQLIVDEHSTGRDANSTRAQMFETQIFDLRALTNYTFQVQVHRFVGEQAFRIGSEMPASNQYDSDGNLSALKQRPSRRLDLTPAAPIRVETTKPFSAEAVKCLADSSEVLVNTGRHFGGRISVEGQTDSRCQLVGNRTSDQSVYLFNVDHKICHSKVMDTNRIETMILVHENKDILTHNTARFLVQCNIGQKSFTVKASVSLPKVMNNLIQSGVQSAAASQQQSFRPALITPIITNKPNRLTADENFSENRAVKLGSMPGVYRLIRADISPMSSALQTQNYLAPSETATLTSANDDKSQLQPQKSDDQLLTSVTNQRSAISSGRLSEAQVFTETPSSPMALLSGARWRQSKELTHLPRAVDVSSGLLFVEGAVESSSTRPNGLISNQREARLVELDNDRGRRRESTNARVLANSHLHQVDGSQPGSFESQSSVLAGANDLATNEEDQNALIMTNNHRVASEFRSLAQDLPSSSSSAPSSLSHHQRLQKVSGTEQTSDIDDANHRDQLANFSVKYSTNVKVNEYSLNRLADELSTTTNGASSNSAPAVQTSRSRSGRMRQIITLPHASSQHQVATSTSPAPLKTIAVEGTENGRRLNFESRMGDMMQVGTGEPTSSQQLSAETTTIKTPAESTSNGQVHRLDNHDLDQINASSSPSNSTFNVVSSPSPSPSPTLAQNITGALIRWSLKQLGSLARKSLESLANGQQDSSEFELDDKPSQLSARTNLRPMSVNNATPKRQINAKEAQLDGFLVESTSGGADDSPKPTTNKNLRSHQIQAPPVGVKAGNKDDNKIRQGRQQRVDEQVTTTQAPRAASMASRNHLAIKTIVEPSRQRDATKQSISADLESSTSSPSTSLSALSDSSAWPISTLWPLGTLITLVALAFYFVIASSRQTKSIVCRNISSPYQVSHFKVGHCGLRSRLDALVSKRRPPSQPPSLPQSPTTTTTISTPVDHSESTLNGQSTSPQRIKEMIQSQRKLSLNDDQVSESIEAKVNCESFYNTQFKFGYKTSSIVDRLKKSTPSPESMQSATTRSTSAASTTSSSSSRGSSVQENYCTNREQFVVYTDYLLLSSDDNSSLADENECLTQKTPSHRLRPPSESFA